MLSPSVLPRQGGSADERRLLRLCRKLDAGSRRSLLDFAEFLADRASDTPAATGDAQLPIPEPAPERRPADESVVAAIKRLRRGYPMLDSGTMLEETSALMAQHVLQGRDAASVIDELEALFERRYAALKAGSS